MTTQVSTRTSYHQALAASTALVTTFNAIYVGVSGDITVILNGVTVAYANVPVGVNAISGDSITAATTADEMVVLSW